MIIKINSENSSKNELYIWNDKLLQLLDLSNKKYSCNEIAEAFKKKYFKRGGIVIDDNKTWGILQISGWRKKMRISVLMSHVIKNFIIDNERPSTKYFSSDYDFSHLNNKEVSDLIKIL